MKSIYTGLTGFVIGLLVAGGICAWNAYKPSLPSVLATPAKELANAKPETLTCKTVVVYKDRVKKDLGLPETVKKDPDKKVTASTKVPASDFPNTVTSVFDLGTGMTDLYVRRDKLAWLAFNSKWRFSAFYGLNDKESGVIMGSAQYEAAQIKSLHVSAIGQVDTSSRYFVGVGLTW